MRKYKLFCPVEMEYTMHEVETIEDIQSIVCTECNHTTKNKVINKRMKVPLFLYEKYMNNGGNKEWNMKKSK